MSDSIDFEVGRFLLRQAARHRIAAAAGDEPEERLARAAYLERRGRARLVLGELPQAVPVFQTPERKRRPTSPGNTA